MSRSGSESVYDNPPIFVVGNARSGTTLMQLMLSAHPRIYITFELSFYNWAKSLKRFESVEEFLGAFCQTGGFQWLGIPEEQIFSGLPSPLDEADLWLAYREMMVQKAALFGRPRWGDKTPNHTRRLEKIYRDFPDARVILMVRDPRTAVESAARMPWGSTSDAANCLSYEGSFKQSAPYLDRLHMVRLEDLQSDPRGEMQRVLRFVGEEWDDAVLDHKRNVPDPEPIPPLPWLQSSRGPVTDEGQEPGLSPVRTRAIESMCKQSMRRYGYEPATLDPEPTKKEVNRCIWSSKGEVVRYVRSILRLFRHLRNPDHWSWEDEGMHERFAQINPSCWVHYPDFEWPTRRSTTSDGPEQQNQSLQNQNPA